MRSGYETVERIRLSQLAARPNPAENPAWANCHMDCGILLDEIERLTKALRIAELKASGTLANNLCPDHRDKQTGKPCLACEIERMSAEIVRLQERIDVFSQNWPLDHEQPD